MLDAEQQKQVEKMRKRIDVANKFYTGVDWYDQMVRRAYAFLTYDIFFMLIAIFVKIGLTVRYNKFVKNL